jgi:hypothetical protein
MYKVKGRRCEEANQNEYVIDIGRRKGDDRQTDQGKKW